MTNNISLKDHINYIENEVRAILDTGATAEYKEASDPINHPSHYTTGNIEVIDYIEDQNFPYHLGNVVKYISRAGKKNDAIEDLKKAQWYLNRYISLIDNKSEDSEISVIQQCRDVWLIQARDPAKNSDPYMGAMYNGMELMMAILEKRSPNYVDVIAEGHERTHSWLGRNKANPK